MKFSLVPAVAAVLSAAAASAQPESAAIGAGFEVERYAVSLAPNPAGKSVTGTESITIRSRRDGLRSVVFSPNALVIDRATVNGLATRVTSDEGGISFALPSPLPRGRTATITLRYHGVPRRGVTATAQSMYTSYFACDWMVCLQDAPGDKAEFELDLLVPTGMTSLAAGRLTGRTTANGGAVIHRWRSTRPYSAYLFGFAVGPFTRTSGRGGARSSNITARGRARPS